MGGPGYAAGVKGSGRGRVGGGPPRQAGKGYTAVASGWWRERTIQQWRVARKRRRKGRAKARPLQSGDARRLQKAWATFATDGGVGVVEGRGELAGSEGVEGAETGVELGGGDAALAIEPAEK